MTPRSHRIFSAAATVVVLCSMAWGMALVGSPETARLLRFDRQRLEDLRTIHREVQSLCRDADADADGQLKRPLPETLEELAASARSEKIPLADPRTGQSYEYTVTGRTTYQLCATFALERNSDSDVFWNHSAGRNCFTIDVLDPP